jgi:hypothetical protein
VCYARNHCFETLQVNVMFEIAYFIVFVHLKCVFIHA